MIELSTVSHSRVTELNPRGKVPVLVEGESVVYESQAILHFLESAHPQPAMIPASPKDRFEILVLVLSDLIIFSIIRAATLTRMTEAAYFYGLLSNKTFSSVLEALQKGQQGMCIDLQFVNSQH